MPSFKKARVVEIIESRPGLQRILVEVAGAKEKAYVLTALTGSVSEQDDVIVNTTAVELGLGTGGWHVVHWNLSREEFSEPGPGHIMKSRYTSMQADVGSTEEQMEMLAEIESVDGMPVVVSGLHSQVPAIAAAFKDHRPNAKLVYIMTDGAAMPIALSDIVYELRQKQLLDATITCGHAFGGDYETVSLFSALAVAKHICKADAAIVAMGPGIVGTNTRLGFSGIEVGPALDAVANVGGQPICALRISHADHRDRHQGVSHHSITALRIATSQPARIALPKGMKNEMEQLREAGIATKHEVVEVDAPNAVALLENYGLDVTTMGRKAKDDPLIFQAAAAAGTFAAQLVVGTSG